MIFPLTPVIPSRFKKKKELEVRIGWAEDEATGMPASTGSETEV